MALGDLVQDAGTIDASGNATISYPSALTEGNLLVLAVGNRSGLTSTTVLSDGWVQRAELAHEAADTNLRILGAVYTKPAEASEPQLVTVESSPFFLHIAEFDSAGETLTFLQGAILGQDNGGLDFSTLDTGVTASVTAASHLNLGVGVVKHGLAMDPWQGWTGDVDTFRSSFDGGGSNQMSISTGIRLDSTSGTKTATLSDLTGTDETDRSAIGAILVFAVGAGGTVIDGTAAGVGGGVGTATGLAVVEGSGAGAGGGTGAAPGTVVLEGTAAGVGGGTGTATGLVIVEATAAGDGGGTGAATGVVLRDGTAVGDGGGTGASAGLVVVEATAVGDGGGVGSATGTVEMAGIVDGTASGDGGGSGTATGIVIVEGTAPGAGGGAGTAIGLVIVEGTASGDGGGVGSATGTVELPGVVDGTAAGDGGGVGTATGLVVHGATATGSGGGVGTAAGVVVVEGTAVGTGGGVGTAVGSPTGPITGVDAQILDTSRRITVADTARRVIVAAVTPYTADIDTLLRSLSLAVDRRTLLEEVTP